VAQSTVGVVTACRCRRGLVDDLIGVDDLVVAVGAVGIAGGDASRSSFSFSLGILSKL
jgi:hypothetical protein